MATNCDTESSKPLKLAVNSSVEPVQKLSKNGVEKDEYGTDLDRLEDEAEGTRPRSPLVDPLVQ